MLWWHLTSVDMSCSHFCSIQKSLLILWFLCWLYWLFKGMYTSLTIFGDFSDVDFWFNFTVVREHTLCDLNRFEFIETCFMAQNIVSLGKWFMCTWKECWVECSINVRLSWLIEFFRSSLSLHILCLLVLSIFKNNFIYLFIYGCVRSESWHVGSLLQQAGFSLVVVCSRMCGLSSCGAQAL